MDPKTETVSDANNPNFRRSITAHKGYGDTAPRQVAAPMPLYVREKISALKISGIADTVKQNDGTLGVAPETPAPPEGSKYLEFEKNGYTPVNVSKEYMDTFNPEAGGYFTVDANTGNHGYIPGEEFEAKFLAL